MKQVSFILLLLGVIQLSFAQVELYFPPVSSDSWETLSIESLGWCPDQIEDLYTYLEDIDSRSFILLKDGKIVLEQYFSGATRDSTYTWFSAGKSLRAVLIGLAQEENSLSITDKTSDYLGTGWTSLSQMQEDSITIWHQLTMTSGLDEANFFCVDPSCLTYVATAGSRWAYHNGPYNMTKNVLEEATGVNHNIYTNRLEERIGMEGVWFPFLGNSFYRSTARDMARFGLLMLNRGTWADDVVLSDTEYVDAMLSPSQSLNPSYGYLWWLNGQESFFDLETSESVEGWMSPNAPQNLYTAAGSGGQLISISPDDNLVMIRQSGQAGENNGEEIIDEIWKRIGLLPCVSNTNDVELDQTHVYPNPVSDFLSIDTSEEKIVDVRIFNVFNTCVYSSTMTTDTLIDVGHLSPGMYFLVIGSSSEVLKFVKE